MNESEHRKSLMDQMQQLGQESSTETALFHQAAAATYGLGITDVKTISALQQEGSMTAGQLSQQLNLTTGAVTNIIDRLERRKIAQRTPDAQDRRKVIVAINPLTLATMDNVYSSMGQSFQALLAHYSTAELEFLVRYYQATIELTKQEIVKLTK